MLTVLTAESRRDKNGRKRVVKEMLTGSLAHFSRRHRPLSQFSRLIFTLLVLIRPHYTIWEPGTGQSQCGQRSLRLGSISAIVAISAITWKPLSSDGQDGSSRSDRSDSKNTNMQCVRSPISRWLTPLVPRNHWIWHVLWTKCKSTSSLLCWNLTPLVPSLAFRMPSLN